MSETSPAYHPGTQIKIRPCLFCNQHMFGSIVREITNERTGQTYTKWGHVCPHCDFWQISKVPKALYAQMDQNHFHEADPPLVITEEDTIPPITNILDYQTQHALRDCPEIRFTCLYCSNPMGSVYCDEETNKRTGQIYVKTRYHCRHCDYWHVIKVPRKLAETVSTEQRIAQKA